MLVKSKEPSLHDQTGHNSFKTFANTTNLKPSLSVLLILKKWYLLNMIEKPIYFFHFGV